MITHRQFFGDAERDFTLTMPMLDELERQTGPFSALVGRIRANTYSLTDLHQTIRLALIGGGTDPQEAAALMATYVHPRPIIEATLLALSIVNAAMFGTEEGQDHEGV